MNTKSQTLTKDQAINLMCDGKKLTHYLFQPEEWITIKRRTIVSEDGVEHPNFWLFRRDSAWESGWSLFD